MDILPIIDELERLYPDARCSLDYKNDYELLIAVRLAAQCTDARVNIVAKALFERYQSLESIANADMEELESFIRPCGFYHTKASDVKRAAGILIEKHNGIVPGDMASLLKLPGVGRKSANVILGEIYNEDTIVVDTHCIRLSNRLRLVKTKDPVKIEAELTALVPHGKRFKLCHNFIAHGRAVCTAPRPKCDICTMKSIVPLGCLL